MSYNVGDLLEAVKGETVVRGRALPHTSGGLCLGEYTAAISYYERQGFTVTVLEKAAPPLPTEPGWYLDKYDDIWGVSAEGRFGYRGRTWAQPGEDVTAYAPFTRLEPVPVTVQKVIDYLERIGRIQTGGPASLDIRKHFGLDK